MSNLSHDTLPRPAQAPKDFAEVHDVASAMAYALAGFHASLDQSGPKWQEAARAYVTAYAALAPLASLPSADVSKVKEIVHAANVLADDASGKARLDVTHDSLPRPKSKPVAFAKVDTVDEAADYALGGYHASLDAAQKGNSAGWIEAARAYLTAYSALQGLRVLASPDIGTVKKILEQANHLADSAGGKAGA
jgi:hypothetical protein